MDAKSSMEHAIRNVTCVDNSTHCAILKVHGQHCGQQAYTNRIRQGRWPHEITVTAQEHTPTLEDIPVSGKPQAHSVNPEDIFV